jgi:hypothetical protein
MVLDVGRESVSRQAHFRTRAAARAMMYLRDRRRRIMGWMVPLLCAASKRREEGDEPCEENWWALPLTVVSLLLLGIAVAVLWRIRLPAIASTVAIAGLIVVLALVALLGSLLR